MCNIRSFADVVKALYQENDYPSDPLIRERGALAGFTEELNRRTKEEFPEEVVAAELVRIRKDKKHTGGLPPKGYSVDSSTPQV